MLLLLMIVPTAVWLIVFAIVKKLLFSTFYAKKPVKKAVDFMTGNKIYKGIVLCSTLLSPVLITVGIMTMNGDLLLDYLWVGFYSWLLTALAYENVLVRAGTALLNLSFLIFVMFGFASTGLEVIPAFTLRAVFPFIPNPWF